MTFDQWLGLLGALGTPLAAIVGLIAKWISNIGKRVDEIGARVTALETKVEVFWRTVSFDAGKILHSPDKAHWRLDELIEAYMEGRIGEQDIRELVDRLRRRRDDSSILRGERMTASIMVRAIEQRFPHLKTGEEGL